MNKFIFVLISAFGLTAAACSKIDSLRPFDDQQAAIVANAMMPPQQKQKSVKHVKHIEKKKELLVRAFRKPCDLISPLY